MLLEDRKWLPSRQKMNSFRNADNVQSLDLGADYASIVCQNLKEFYAFPPSSHTEPQLVLHCCLPTTSAFFSIKNLDSFQRPCHQIIAPMTCPHPHTSVFSTTDSQVTLLHWLIFNTGLNSSFLLTFLLFLPWLCRLLISSLPKNLFPPYLSHLLPRLYAMLITTSEGITSNISG